MTSHIYLIETKYDKLNKPNDNNEKFFANSEQTLEEYILNVLGDISKTKFTKKDILNKLPNELPKNDSHFVLKTQLDENTENWKLYQSFTKDKGWIRSNLQTEVKVIKELFVTKIKQVPSTKTDESQVLSVKVDDEKLKTEDDKKRETENKEK